MAGFCNHALDLTAPAGDPGSRVHRLDPRAKVLGLFAVTLVAVSTPLHLWPVFAACAAVLVAVAVAARVRARDVWRRGRLVLVPVLAVAFVAPLVRTGGAAWAVGPLTIHEAGLDVLGLVAAKALVGTLAAVLLTATTTFPAVLRALEALRVPRLFVLVAAFMHRYLFVITGEAARMRTAAFARGYRPRHMLHAGTVGRVAGALFLRSYARGERVYVAMLARGYQGRMPALEPLVFRRADAMFVGAVLVTLGGLRTVLGVAA